MMIKTCIAVAVTLTVCTLAATSMAGNDGTIEFTGAISSTTCKVEGGAAGIGTADKSVDLGNVSIANLAATGERAGSRGFEIIIGGAGDGGCTNGQTARVRFDPTSPAIDTASGRLNLDASASTAGNVQIEVADRDGTPINLYTEDSQRVTIANNQAVIPLMGRYYATGVATAGDANSRVAFQIIYD